MSSIPNGGSNLFITPGSTAHWIITWNSGGWQGNTLIEVEPLNTGVGLDVEMGNIDRNSSGQYQFAWSVKNNGPNNTFYNAQVSSN